MLLWSAIVFGVSSGLFVVWFFIAGIEAGRGQRLFFSRWRGWLDRYVQQFERYIVHYWNHFVRYIVQLHWYYGVHSFLRALLRSLVAMYEFFERRFEQNRSRTKALRAERRQAKASADNHLSQINQHKADTKLSPVERANLRDQKLEDRSW